MRLFYQSLVTLLITLFAQSWMHQAHAQESTKQNDNKPILYEEDFDHYKSGELPSDWWVEGGEAVYVKNGHLMIEADPKEKRAPGYVATVWNRKIFSGDIRVEFDTRVINSTINTNNINFFLYYSHPGADSTLYGTRNLRLNGLYNHYYELNGYIFTFLNASGTKSDKARFRMRRCPGFELINEKYGYENHKGRTYHITITKRGNELTYAVDGTIYLHAKDTKYNWAEGLIGFRTFHTDLWFDNIVVSRLSPK